MSGGREDVSVGAVRNSALFRLWTVSEKKYLLFMQFLCKLYLSLAAIYVSRLARRIVDENIFLVQPREILLQFTIILLAGVGVSFLYMYCTNCYSIELSCRLKNMGMERLTRCETAESCYCLNEVTFAYDEKTVLEKMSLRIPRGEMTAFVGESGSGKSTLFQLFLGFYQPVEGSIGMYGKDMSEWDLEALRSEIAYVEQTPYLFNGTVRENIAAGRENATEEEIVQAAKSAYAHEFILELPQGYDTKLSEGGKNLSGGQRQRLAIARAFVKNAPVLLLDEMSSALDQESERLIQLAIDQYRRNRTILMIAHRLQSVVTADRIVVLDKGRIAECGTHDELMGKNGIYARLYRMGERG